MIEIRDLIIQGNRDFQLQVPELKISSGQFIQVVGNNNSGKSLLLKVLSFEYREFKGEIEYNGFPAKSGSYKALLISSETALLPEASVNRNIFLPFQRVTKRKKETIMGLLKNTGLLSSINDPVYTLSRSEKKSLELVRAVVQLPHYLLLDDYDTYFDNHSLNKLSAVFEFAAKSGTTIMVTSNQQIENLSNNYIINGGVLEKL